MQHSYSGLKAYETCPRQWHEIKVLKNFPREETEATLYGTQLHEQAELYIKDGRPVDKGFMFMQPMLEQVDAMPGRKFTELEMALTADLKPCKFKDKNYWVRGIADLVVVDDENMTARCFDFKSGNDKYPDTDQLMLMSLMIFKIFPIVRSITGGLLFVLKNTTHRYRVDRSQEDVLWWRWKERVARMDAAMEHGVWNPKPSGLCRKYCAVTTCEHNGRRS